MGLMPLRALRELLGVTVEAVALAMGVDAADVEGLEERPLELLAVGELQRFVGALGCRLDVVAQHIDGAAHWLTETRS